MRRFFIIERPMSFYFKLETTVPLDPNKVLTFLDNKKVCFRQDDPGTTVFYMPGGSLRGVNVYDEANGLSIGINAFTTRFDALLTRDITIALAKLHACAVQPEDLETPLLQMKFSVIATTIGSRRDNGNLILFFLQIRPLTVMTRSSCLDMPVRLQSTRP